MPARLQIDQTVIRWPPMGTGAPHSFGFLQC